MVQSHQVPPEFATPAIASVPPRIVSPRISKAPLGELPWVLTVVGIFLTWLVLIAVIGTGLLRLWVPFSFATSVAILVSSFGLTAVLFWSQSRTLTLDFASNMRNLAGSAGRQRYLLVLFSLSLVAMLACLYCGRTDQTILRPFSDIPDEFCVASAVAVAALTVLLFTDTDVSLALICVAVASAVFASFALIIYPAIFGTDIWAYLTNLRWLYDGNVLPRYQTLYTGANLYGGIFSLELVFAKSFRLDPCVLVWYPPLIMQSFTIPFLIFGTCWFLTKNQRISLLMSASSLAIYDIWIWNSYPSANALGRVFMLFSILTWMAFAQGRIKVVLPLLSTLGALVVYPMTGLYAITVGALVLTDKKSKGNRWLMTLVGAFLFVLIPAGMLVLPTLAEGAIGVGRHMGLVDVIGRLFLASWRNGLSTSPLDVGTFPVSVLSFVGMFLMFRQRSDLKVTFPILVAITVVLAQSVASDVMGAPSLRIHSTVLPFFLLMGAACALDQLPRLFRAGRSLVVSRGQKRVTLTLRLVPAIASRKIVLSILVVLLVVGNVSLYAFIPVRGPNASTDLLNAVAYVVQQDSTHSALIVADQLSTYTLAATAQGDWYKTAGRRFGEPLIALSETRSAYFSMLRQPQQAREYVREASEELRGYLLEIYGLEHRVTLAFVIYDPAAAYLNLQKALETKLALDEALGSPRDFGTVFVYVVQLSASE